MKLGTVEIKGKKFDIEVGENGQFSTNHDGDQVHAPTLDQLKCTGNISGGSYRRTEDGRRDQIAWHQASS